MNYQQAWEHLELELRARGEFFFYAKGDDEHSIYALGEKSIETTLAQMKAIEKKITKLKVVK